MIKTLFFTEQSLAKKYEAEIFNALVHLEILLLGVDQQNEQHHITELVGWAMKLKEKCLKDRSVDFAGDVVKQYWRKKTSVQQTAISLRIKSEIKKKYPKVDLYYFTKANVEELVDRYSRVVDANSKENAASYIRRKMGII